PEGTTIEVTVKATSEAGNCSASGSARTSVKTKPVIPPPPTPQASLIDSCTTFKRNNARVDNACKEILQSKVIPALQADPGARVFIDGYRGEKEKPVGLSLQ